MSFDAYPWSHSLAMVLLWGVVPPRDAWGRLGLMAMVGLIAVIWASGPFAPPPPSETAIAVVGLALWVFPFWAWRIDRHRASAPS